MSNTFQFELPLMSPSQAQKHITYNEAIARLDALANLRLVSISATIPPSSPVDGVAYFVPALGAGDWVGGIGKIAIYFNGEWSFIAPKFGWQAWVEDVGATHTYGAGGWNRNGQAAASYGATTVVKHIVGSHTIESGAAQDTTIVIPANTLVIGVSARVVQEIVTNAGGTGWALGVAADESRFGSGYGLALNSYASSLSGSPTAYYSDTPIRIKSLGADFQAQGSLRICVHCLHISPPSMV